jgi:hypothetical protein
MMQINWDKYLDYNEKNCPPSMREIIYVRGTDYEMGYQYGSQTKEMIKRNFCLIASDALQNFTKEEVLNKIEPMEKIISERTPEISQWYQGIADGAGMSYGDVVLINLQLWTCIEGMMCSTIAAKDSATEDGNLILGINGDVTYNMSSYGVTLVCFPENGNTIVTLPQLAGQLGSNFVLNDKGLAITFTGGESNRPKDRTLAYADFIGAMFTIGCQCSNAVEAKKKFLELDVMSGWNYLFADINKEMSIIEKTSALFHERKPGDHGEKDFILATNHFVDEGMRLASHDYEENMDSYFRYDTEKKLLEENLGHLNLENMMAILGFKQFWDGERWNTEDVWDEFKSDFTPEMCSANFRTGTRCFAVPEEKTAYILHGCSEAVTSYMPRAKGKFAKIMLADTEEEMTSVMEEDAVVQVWKAAAKIVGKDKEEIAAVNMIDEAKEHLWIGKNYLAKARLARACGNDEARCLYGKAASELSYAYIIAQII